MKRNRYKSPLIIIALMIIVILIIMLKSCLSDFNNKVTDNSSKQVDVNKENTYSKILKSSDTYFIGQWSLEYKDIVHYQYDEDKNPQYNIYNQPSSMLFNQVGEGLIYEEEYAVTERNYNDVDFSLGIELPIVNFKIVGHLEDESTWRGEFEYYDYGNNLLSKCNVIATRIN